MEKHDIVKELRKVYYSLEDLAAKGANRPPMEFIETSEIDWLGIQIRRPHGGYYSAYAKTNEAEVEVRAFYLPDFGPERASSTFTVPVTKLSAHNIKAKIYTMLNAAYEEISDKKRPSKQHFDNKPPLAESMFEVLARMFDKKR